MASAGMPGPESETVTDQESASTLPTTRTRPPDRRVFQRVRHQVAEDLLAAGGIRHHRRTPGNRRRDSQWTWRAAAIGANWRSISWIRAPMVKLPEAERAGALDEAGVVEVAPREPEQVVAERDHRQDVAALIGGERRGGSPSSRSKPAFREVSGRQSSWLRLERTDRSSPRSIRSVIAPPVLRRWRLRSIGHPWPDLPCSLRAEGDGGDRVRHRASPIHSAFLPDRAGSSRSGGVPLGIRVRRRRSDWPGGDGRRSGRAPPDAPAAWRDRCASAPGG